MTGRKKPMAPKKPTPISFLGKIRLCWLALFRPEKFAQLEIEDNKLLHSAPDFKTHRSVDLVRRAFFGSLVAVTTASITGAAVGFLANAWFSYSEQAIAVCAIFGAVVLLWATSANAGWGIQSYSDVTLSERVNRWLVRTLYWLGTTALVVAATWALGEPT